MMAKFNVGDKVRVTAKSANLPQGTVVTIEIGPIGSGRGGNYHFRETHEVVLGDDLELVTEYAPPKPKKSARITALESQVADLQAKVEALEAQSKPAPTHSFADSFPLTAKFEREVTVVKSPNQQRADVIKRAQAFVAKYNGILEDDGILRAEFVINPEKRTVVTILHGLLTGKIRDKSFAKCDPDDVFNESIGKAIALARALNVDVPVEFVKAVQPTEAAVGMRMFTNSSYGVMTIANDNNFRAGKMAKHMFRSLNGTKIMDDSDAVYE